VLAIQEKAYDNRYIFLFYNVFFIKYAFQTDYLVGCGLSIFLCRSMFLFLLCQVDTAVGPFSQQISFAIKEWNAVSVQTQ